jgi:hypothetical protein
MLDEHELFLHKDVGWFEHAGAPGLLSRLPSAIVGAAPVPRGTAQER